MVLRSWNPFAEGGWGGCLCEPEPNMGRVRGPPAAWGTQAFGTGCRVGQREFTEGEPWPSAFSGPLCLLSPPVSLSVSLQQFLPRTAPRALLSPRLTRELGGSVRRGQLHLHRLPRSRAAFACRHAPPVP